MSDFIEIRRRREAEFYEEQDEEAMLVTKRMSPFHTMVESSITNVELGALLREYVLESEHGSWEGFSFADQMGIANMLADMARYREASKEIDFDPAPKHDPGQF